MESTTKEEIEEISDQKVKVSKKQMDREAKKYKKKVAQAQSVLVKAEDRKYEDIIWNKESSKYLFVTHFGNGDEYDQNVLMEFCSEKGGPIRNLTIFPGKNYGHLEFKDVESAEKLLNTAMVVPNCANIKFAGSQNPDRTVVFFYTPMTLAESKQSAHVEIGLAEDAATGSIPGLYVYNDVITPDEEAEMLKKIDEGKWTKLLNRRVQHFGYEFKYGTNNVDTTDQVGDLPDFCNPLRDNLTKVLKSFKTSDKPQEAIKLFDDYSLPELTDEILDE